MYKYKERLRLYKRWPSSIYILYRINWRQCNVTWSARFLSHMNHVSVKPTDGTGPTQGQRKTLTRVGIEPTTFGLDLRRSTDWATRSDGSRPWELKMLKSRQLTCTSTRKGYVYTNVGRLAVMFYTELTEESVMEWKTAYPQDHYRKNKLCITFRKPITKQEIIYSVCQLPKIQNFLPLRMSDSEVSNSMSFISTSA